MDNCFTTNGTNADKCNCFIALDLNSTFTALTNCNLKPENDEILKNKRECAKSKIIFQDFNHKQSYIFTEVLDCKKAEVDSVDHVDKCKASIKCGGAGSKEEGEQLLKVLEP